MALNIAQMSVGTAGTDRIVLPGSLQIGVRLRNVGEVTVYLGSAQGFPVSNGYPVRPGEEFEYNSEAGSTIFLSAAAGTGTLAYFYVS